VKFFEYLDTIGVEHIQNGEYVIFQKKALKWQKKKLRY
jgi:hypothetical protein